MNYDGVLPVLTTIGLKPFFFWAHALQPANLPYPNMYTCQLPAPTVKVLRRFWMVHNQCIQGTEGGKVSACTLLAAYLTNCFRPSLRPSLPLSLSLPLSRGHGSSRNRLTKAPCFAQGCWCKKMDTWPFGLSHGQRLTPFLSHRLLVSHQASDLPPCCKKQTMEKMQKHKVHL